MLAGTVVLVPRRRLNAAFGLVRDKAQVQDEGGEGQADKPGERHNRIVNGWTVESESPPRAPRAI